MTSRPRSPSWSPSSSIAGLSGPTSHKRSGRRRDGTDRAVAPMYHVPPVFRDIKKLSSAGQFAVAAGLSRALELAARQSSAGSTASDR